MYDESQFLNAVPVSSSKKKAAPREEEKQLAASDSMNFALDDSHHKP